MTRRFSLIMAMVVALTLGAFGALASTTMLEPFTQTELDSNWEADRYFPTGGVTSVSAFQRDNVAELGIDSDAASTNPFQWYEGIKTVGDQNLGQALQVDLYLDSSWQGTAVNAGVWVVGDDGSGNRDNLFAIIEYVNNGSVPADFRIWDSATGDWEYLDADLTYDTWVTLSITLDTDAQQYSYAIDGEEVGTVLGGQNFIREVFLNSANYGERPETDYPGLNNDSYAAHWHAGVEGIDSKDQCQDGNWEAAGFKNQGQCIRFVSTGQDSR